MAFLGCCQWPPLIKLAGWGQRASQLTTHPWREAFMAQAQGDPAGSTGPEGRSQETAGLAICSAHPGENCANPPLRGHPTHAGGRREGAHQSLELSASLV